MQQTPVPDEKSFSYPIAVETAMCDERGAFYPSAYQSAVIGMIERHLSNLEMDVPRVIKRYGVSWCLLSMSMALSRPLHPDDRLTAKTWLSRAKLPIYRREFVLSDESGSTVAVGATFSTLLDLTARRICTNPAVLSQFALPEGETLLEASSRFLETPAFVPVEQRTVRPSWIDRLGHVHNSRYGDLVTDALSDVEREALIKLSRLDVWFMAELQRDTVFMMEKATDGNAVYVRGVIEPTKKVSFVMKLTF